MSGSGILTAPGFDAWLAEQNASLAFTTYQRGRLFFLGRRDDGRLWAHERLLEQCQGLCVDGDGLWVSGLYQLWRFGNALAPGTTAANGADRLFAPRAGYVTGRVDVHDIGVLTDGRPVFVNTLYGCLATVSEAASFVPLWRPPFVSALMPEDRCHLNGLAMAAGRPRYVTAVSRSDVAAGWRDRRRDGGVIVDVDSGEIVCDGLSMPHSPRLHDGRLWVLNSGTGELGRVDVAAGRFEPVCFCPGYARGLAFVGGHAVIGLSQPRENRTFAGLALDDRLRQKDAAPWCGLLFVDLASGAVRSWARLDETLPINEIYDVAVLPGVRQPAAIGFRDPAPLERTIVVGAVSPVAPEAASGAAATADALVDEGLRRIARREVAAARALFERAVVAVPDHAHAHNNLGLCLLLQGDYGAGAREFEWRRRVKDLAIRRFPVPRWTGEALAGKRIFLHTEDGIGDALQFVRFAAAVKARGGHVTVGCDRRLKALVATAEGVDAVVGEGERVAAFDVEAPLASLMAILGVTAETLPAPAAYLRADTARVAALRERLHDGRRLVGIAWSSAAPGTGAARSLAAAELVAALAAPDVALVSLQYGDTAADDADIAARGLAPPARPADIDPMADLDGFAALVAAMDAVVTIANSTAHFAGALGVPTHVLLPFAPQWRWGLEGSGSRWYPSAVLHRTDAPGDWRTPLASARAALGLAGGAVPAPEQRPSAASLIGESDRARGKGRFVAARRALRHAVAMAPGAASAWNNLGGLDLLLGEPDAAIGAFRRALDCDPEYLPVFSNLLTGLAHRPDATPATIGAESRRFGARAARLAGPRLEMRAVRDPERRLRVGYLTPGLSRHVLRQDLLPVIEAHDRAGFEIHLFAHVPSPDDATARFRALADGWTDIHGLDDRAAATAVRDAEIDILVHPMGHWTDNRLPVLALKPAPVQIAYAGNAQTTGLDTVDLVLADRWIDDGGAVAPHCTERLVALETGLQVTAYDDAPPIGPPPVLRNGFVTFASFNSPAKLGDACLALWARVLDAVPGSRLALKYTLLVDPATLRHLRRRAADAGIPPDRLDVWKPVKDHAAHLATYGAVDVALDTTPFSGGRTTQDALWMGVPVVTRAGATVQGRYGVSTLSRIGCPELIAAGDDAFVAAARALAQAPDRLAGYRETLRDRFRRSPIMGFAGHVRELETVYRDAWRRWCRTEESR